jgi:hypothetical protein
VALDTPAPPIGRRAQATWLMFGGLFTGLVLAFGVVGSWVLFNGSAPPISPRTEQVVYPQLATRVEVDIDDGDVRVVGGASEVALERRLEYATRRPVATETWRGDTLVIQARCELSGFDRARGERCRASYVLRVPTAVTIEAKVGLGAIRIDDVDGELRLSTDSGNVDVRNARGRLRVLSKSGTITATGLRGSEAITQTSFGDVSLDFAGAPGLVRAIADVGAIEVALPRGDNGAVAYQVRADTTGPRYIDVSIDPASPHQVFATAKGAIYVRYSNA